MRFAFPPYGKENSINRYEGSALWAEKLGHYGEKALGEEGRGAGLAFSPQ
jgi:hypothetical protein